MVLGFVTLFPEDGDNMLFRNVSNQLPDYVTPKSKALIEEYNLGCDAVRSGSVSTFRKNIPSSGS
jgi:hypothetical protein